MISASLQQQLSKVTQMYDDGRLVPPAYYAIVQGIAESLPRVEEEETVDPPTRLHRALARLRTNPHAHRDHENVKGIYPLIAQCESYLPVPFLRAVKGNLDAYDGKVVPGEVVRNGLLAIPAKQARLYGMFPTGKELKPGTVLFFGALPSLLLRPTPYEYPGGFTGTYPELWYRLLTPVQRVNALRLG